MYASDYIEQSIKSETFKRLSRRIRLLYFYCLEHADENGYVHDGEEFLDNERYTMAELQGLMGNDFIRIATLENGIKVLQVIS